MSNCWHEWCERWDDDESASEVGYPVMGEPIVKGDWYFSEGYLVKCPDQTHKCHTLWRP